MCGPISPCFSKYLKLWTECCLTVHLFISTNQRVLNILFYVFKLCFWIHKNANTFARCFIVNLITLFKWELNRVGLYALYLTIINAFCNNLRIQIDGCVQWLPIYVDASQKLHIYIFTTCACFTHCLSNGFCNRVFLPGLCPFCRRRLDKDFLYLKTYRSI